jgi:hypothetical protein
LPIAHHTQVTIASMAMGNVATASRDWMGAPHAVVTTEFAIARCVTP